MKEQLYNNLVAANNHKQNIINNQGAYYNIPYRVKDVHKTLFRHSKSHIEYAFNQAQYNQDINNADVAINNAQAVYNQEVTRENTARQARQAEREARQAERQEAAKKAAWEEAWTEARAGANQATWQAKKDAAWEKISYKTLCLRGTNRVIKMHQPMSQFAAPQEAKQAAKQHIAAWDEEIRQEAITKEQNKLNQTNQLLNQTRAEIQTKNAQTASKLALHNQNTVEITRLTNQKNMEQNNIRNLVENNRVLTNDLNQKQSSINSLNQNLAATRNNITQINAQLASEISRKENVQRQVSNKQKISDNKHNKSEETKTRISKMLEEQFNEQSRTELLVKLLLKPNSELSSATIEHIYEIGFDVNLLAYLAVTKNDATLLVKASQAGADFTNLQINELGNKTLLQYMLDQKQEFLLNKTLQLLSHEQLVSALLNAVAQNDLTLTYKLLSFDNSLLATQFKGLSLLQYAICCENVELVRELLKLNPGLATANSDSGEHAINFIFRSLNKEIFDIYAQHVDVTSELKQLIANNNIQILNKLLLLDNVLDQNQTQELLQYAVANRASDNVIKLIENLDQVYSQETLNLAVDFENESINESVLEDQINDQEEVDFIQIANQETNDLVTVGVDDTFQIKTDNLI